MAIHRAALAGLGSSFATEIGRLETESTPRWATSSTCGSPKQLEQVLFYELDLPRGRRTKTGYSTDATVLEELRPGPRAIAHASSSWRRYTKLKSTYVDALPLMLDPRTGRIHTTFHQAVAATGRLCSSDPNLQNIPIRTELGRSIRRAFVRRRAGQPRLLAADYSQIELRILAHVSGDAALLEAFAARRGRPPGHGGPGVPRPPADVTPDERDDGQDGQLRHRLRHERLRPLVARRHPARGGTGVHRAATSPAYSGISYYMLHITDRPASTATSTTLLGRRRYHPRAPAAQPEPARPRRADGHQHAHPGHRRGHHEDRHDPAAANGCGARGSGPASCSRCTTSWSSRCRAARSPRWLPLVARDDGHGDVARRAARRRRQGGRRLGADDAGPGTA